MSNDPKWAYNRAPILTGENYNYWKDCMCIHINSIDMKVWKVIQDGPMEITMTHADGVVIPKLEAQWNE